MSVGDERRAPAFLEGGGRMGALMRSHDWSRSPLGPPESWPDALKSAVSSCLSTRFPMVIWWGPQLIMLYNDAWQPILGETKHPAGLGRPGADSWPETWSIVGAQFEDALRGVASWSEDLLLASDRHGFLEECYFTYSHSPLRDAAGRVVGVVSVVSETTARVLNERRLRVLRDLSNATLEATSQPTSLDQVSRALLEILCVGNPDAPFAVQYLGIGGDGASRVAAVGVDASLFPHEIRVEDEDVWGIGEVLRGRSRLCIGPKSALATPLPGGAWPEPTRQVAALPLIRSTGQAGPCGVLLVGLNSRLQLDARYADFLGLVAARLAGAVSTLQLLEKERVARSDAERAARVKDDFLAALSHELRTPLNAVIGWTQILKSDLEDVDAAQAAIDVIERNAQHQVRLITDLLDVSRIQSGSLRLELRDVDLASIVAAAVDSVLPSAAAKRIEVRTALAEIAKPVQGDAARIEQIVWNLLVNAVKFTPAGGHVDVALECTDSHAEIRVRDDGEGIEPAFLRSIFDGFRQADGSASRAYGGLGLGLTIARKLAELHGGHVHAASDGKGRGALFTVTLPLGARSHQVDRLEPPWNSDSAAPASLATLEGLRILAIDDEPDSLSMIRRILEDRGARVRTAVTAASALELAGRERFDVILSDIAMPRQDGYALLAALRAREIRTPAIALTAFAHADDRARALAAGYRAHVAKPVDTAALVEAVARLAAEDARRAVDET